MDRPRGATYVSGIVPESHSRAALRGAALVFSAVSFFYAAILVQSRTWQPAADLGLAFDDETLRLTSLRSGGAAERAGLEPHDRLLAIDDKPVKTALEVHDAVRRTAPGETLRLTVNLAGLNRGRTYTVPLDARPEDQRVLWLARAGRGLALSLPLLALALASFLLFQCPARPEAWWIALATVGAIACVPLLSSIENIPPGARGFALAFKVIFGLSAPAFVHYLLSISPEPSAFDRADPRIKLNGIALSLAAGLPFAVWALVSSGTGFYLSVWPTVGTAATAVAWIAALGLGGYSLWDCATTSSSSDTTLRARFMAIAACAAAAPALLYGILGFTGWAAALALLPLALLPLGVGYALLATRVLPLSFVLRCSLRWFAVGRGAVFSIVALGGLVGLACADLLAGWVGNGAAFKIVIALSCTALAIVGGFKLHARKVETLDRMLSLEASSPR